MQVLVATDKFKHSLTAFDVCKAVSDGFLLSSAHHIITPLPLSDGGDGLAGVLAYYVPSQKHEETVADPLFRPVKALFYMDNETKTAFVEMAAASGLRLLKPEEYNCAVTSTYGTGELIKAALEKGAKKIILGIGGSATNDCGTGMAQALGYRFLDRKNEALKPVGENLIRIEKIDASAALSLAGVEVIVACDVDNLLTGSEGAARMYAPQKGANPQTVEELEAGAVHFAEVVKRATDIDISSIKGGGAAGGTGAGCVAFLKAKLVSGTELVLAMSKAEEKIKEADVVITGEGKIDAQTAHGKIIAGVARLCARHGKPLIAVCGTLAISPEQEKELGMTAAFSILNGPMPLTDAYQNAYQMLVQTAYNIARLADKKI